MDKLKWFEYEEIHNKRQEWRWESDVHLEHIFLSGKKYTTLVKQNEFKLEDPFYLHKYHILQSELSQKEYIINDVDLSLLYENEEIHVKQIIFRVLSLDPNQIYLVSNRKDKQDYLISTPEYIQGDTLYQLIDSLPHWTGNIITQSKNIDKIVQIVEKNVQRQANQLAKLLWFDVISFMILDKNITIEAFKNSSLYLCCTDIASSIKNTVELNNDLILSLRNSYNIDLEKLWIIQNYAKYLREQKNQSDREFVKIAIWS